MKRFLFGIVTAFVLTASVGATQLSLTGAGVATPPAPIGTPVTLGSGTTTTTGAISMAGGVNIQANDGVVIYIMLDGSSSVTVNSISDGTNSYTFGCRTGFNSSVDHEIWYKIGASAVTTPTITATLSGSTSGTAAQMMHAARVPNMNAIDKCTSTQTSSTSPTLSTGTLATALEAVFCGFGNFDSRFITPPASGFTALSELGVTNSAKTYFEYQSVAATTSVTCTFTWNSVVGAGAGIILASFR